MNLEETYILNPAYALKRDSKRVVLTSYEEVGKELNGIKYDNSTIFLLHPINAQMLAFFDGTRTLSACISEMAAYFGLAEEEIRKSYPNSSRTKTGCISVGKINLSIFRSTCWSRPAG